jgi:alpha-N-arabinofuranosidase
MLKTRLPALAVGAFLSIAGAVHAQDTLVLTVEADKAGPKISRQIFGQFAEHLGRGIYEGVWVGPNSSIPNTRGIRNDVVAALKELHVPNVRWPGGCFADEYHWRNGIGPAAERPATLNPNWGGVIEPNTFGTHEFLDFVQQIGAEAYMSVNVGSGTSKEAADWFEYLTTDQPTALAKERGANGHLRSLYPELQRAASDEEDRRRSGQRQHELYRSRDERVEGAQLELGHRWIVAALLHRGRLASEVRSDGLRRG